MPEIESKASLFGRIERGQWSQEFRYLRSREWLGQLEGKRVLDLGCGRGLYLKYLRELKAEVIGVDVVAEALRIARQYAGEASLGLCLGSGSSLPFLDQSFDAVLSIEVLSHVPHAHQEEVVKEIGRVLRPGGRAIVSVHNPARFALQNLIRLQRPQAFYPNPGLTIYPIAQSRLMSGFSRCGFAVVDEVVFSNLYNSIHHKYPAISPLLRRMEDGVSHVPLLRRMCLTMLVRFEKCALSTGAEKETAECAA